MSLSNVVQRLIARILLILLPATSIWAVENHVVPMTELHARAVEASEARQSSLSRLDHFFSLDPVRKALDSVKLDGAQVRRAVSMLSAEELERLRARADKLQADLAAGALSNQELTYIVIALATAVIVLIIVKA